MPDTILFALRMSHFFFGVVMTMTALFLILLVLVQRGRGGGLSGALGGMGGQSAFGTKAGDTFTKITIAGSIFWILLCVIAVRSLSPLQAEEDEGEQNAVQQPSDGLVPPPSPDDPATSDNTDSADDQTGDDQTGDDQTGDDAGASNTEETTEPDGTAEPEGTAAPVDPPVNAESNPDDATDGSDNNDSADDQ